MRKLVVVFGVLGASWMVFLIHSRQIQLAYLTNYPGFSALRVVSFRGIAPPQWFVWTANVWMVASSAIEWMIVVFVLTTILRRVHRARSSRSNLTSSV